MLIRLSRNAFVRSKGKYAYVENQVNHISRVYQGKAAMIIGLLSRKPQQIKDVIYDCDRQSIHISDTMSMVKEWEFLWFITLGETEEELNRKENNFSYSLVKEIDQKFSNMQIPAIFDTPQEPWLRMLQLEITSLCNENCIHCYIPSEKKNHCDSTMTLGQIKQIITQFTAMKGLRICLSGGEVFVHKDIINIMRYCREKDMMIFLQSNLTLFDDEMIKIIKELNVFNVQVSLYSLNPEIHDSITGLKGSWKKTKQNLEKLITANIPVTISCPLMQKNYSEIKDMQKYADSLGVFCYFDYVMMAQSNFCTNNLHHRITTEQTSKIMDVIIETNPQYKEMFKHASSAEALDNMPFMQRRVKCSVMRSHIGITVHGDVYPCPGWQGLLLGNVFEQSLADIWNCRAAWQLRDIKMSDFKECEPCKLKNYCDMCMVYNYNENHGDIYNICSRFCENAKLLRDKIRSKYNLLSTK